MSPKRVIILGVSVVLFLIVIVFSGSLVENIPADSAVVIQMPISGELRWYTEPGLQWQWFGKVHYYKKSFQYWFSQKEDQGKKGTDESIATRFNDGGHATISGSVRIDLPLIPEKLTQLHIRYGNQSAIEHELVRTTFERSIYMAGPLMSSAESYSDKRNKLIEFIEDQAHNGVYRTTTKFTRTKDPITGAEKTISVVDLMPDKNAPGGYERSEPSPLNLFAVKSYNLSINRIKYDEVVEKQIMSQQSAIMDVQSAIAESRKAEQRAMTAEQEGKAKAATSKWEQEVIKAKAVVLAQQGFEVAEWQKKQMEMYRDSELLRAEGDATYKKKVMEADGALAPKLEVYQKIMFKFAEEFGKQKWVPEVIMGGGHSGADNGANTALTMIDIMGLKAAKDLALDLSMKTSAPQKK